MALATDFSVSNCEWSVWLTLNVSNHYRSDLSGKMWCRDV